MKNPIRYLLPLALLGLVLGASAASADYQFACLEQQSGLQENLTIKGSGTSATIHVEDQTASGDCTYDAQVPAVDGYLVFMGTFMDKLDNPPQQIQGALLFQPALLNGQPGNMRRLADDDWITVPCKRVN